MTFSKVQLDEATHTYTLDGKTYPSVTDICSMLRQSESVPLAVLEYAARRGTAVHELCELLDYGCETDGIPCEPELVGYVLAYMRFLRDYKPEWELIEYSMCSPALGYAGTLDRFGRIDGRPVLLDIKTTASPDRVTRVSWACQLAGYSFLLDKDGIRCVDLQLRKDGTYRLIDARETEEKNKFDSRKLFADLVQIHEITRGGAK